MSRHSSRKCSLAIESPIDDSCNNPLNAFLIYSGKTDTHSNNNNGADDEMATTDESMSPLASSTFLSPMTPPGSRNTTQLSNQQLTKPLRCHRRPSMIKCTSLPELTAMSTHTVTTSPPLSSLITNSTTHAILGNRRISICDLDNFTGRLIMSNNNNTNNINNNYKVLILQISCIVIYQLVILIRPLVSFHSIIVPKLPQE